MTQPDPEPFGFTVRREPDWRKPGSDDRWSVQLPHQCDTWDIAGEYRDGIPHAEAVAALERFITEAQTALAALRERRETEGS